MIKTPEDRQSGTEIEITPEMVEAGVEYLRESGWITEEHEPSARGLRFLVRDLLARVCGEAIPLRIPTDASLIDYTLYGKNRVA